MSFQQTESRLQSCC